MFFRKGIIYNNINIIKINFTLLNNIFFFGKYIFKIYNVNRYIVFEKYIKLNYLFFGKLII